MAAQIGPYPTAFDSSVVISVAQKQQREVPFPYLEAKAPGSAANSRTTSRMAWGQSRRKLIVPVFLSIEPYQTSEPLQAPSFMEMEPGARERSVWR